MPGGIEVNKESHSPGEVWTVLVPENRMAVVFCLNAIDPGSMNHRQALVYNWGGLVNPDETTPRAIRTTDRAALLFHPGTWVIRTDDAAVAEPPLPKEDYLIIYVDNLEAACAVVSLLGSSALNKFDLIRWGTQAVSAAQLGNTAGFDEDLYGPVVNARLSALGATNNEPWSGRNGDADGDWAATLFAAIVNARLAAYSREATDFARIEADDLAYATGKSNATAKLLQAAAAVMGNDTSDNTLRAVEARVMANGSLAVTGLYRLLTEATLRCVDLAASSNTRPVYVSQESGASAGIATTSYIALLTKSLQAKLDTDAALVHASSMSRYVRTATVNPTALQVVGTLDCRGQTNKSLRIDFTAADTARVQVSADGTNWETIEDIGGTPAAFAPTTAVLLEAIKGWRHVRVLAVAGFTGTATVTITAQGG